MSQPAVELTGAIGGAASIENYLLADVGNSRVKLAAICSAAAGSHAFVLSHRLTLAGEALQPEALTVWLKAAAAGPTVLLVASVHDALASRLEAMLVNAAEASGKTLVCRRIQAADLPLAVAVPEPEKVGIDRLAAAAAAVWRRPAEQPVVVVDCGTAVTVDLVSAAGAYLGGSIFPGTALLAKALAGGTSQLPEVMAFAGSESAARLGTAEAGSAQAQPEPVMPGSCTAEAITAGVVFGTRGAVARLVREAVAVVGPALQVVLTGGGAAVVRQELPQAVEVPDLVLEGVALAASKALARKAF